LTREKKGEPTWSDVKSAVIGLDHKRMVELAGDLYRLSKENKNFFHARFGVGEDQLGPYKKIIHECMYPNIDRGNPIQISKAKGAIRSYVTAVLDPVGEAELMTFFVECGNNFTVEYGDIDEGFYNALNLMYKRAIERVLSLPAEQRGEFRDRLEEIMMSSSGIGGGDHEELRNDFCQAFPEDG
jgi:hypothetical protein